MKKSKILIMVGPILILIGIGLVWGAVMPSEATESFTIPEGPYYYAFESTTILGLRLEGEFDVDGVLGTVNFYVMTPEQFDAYANLGETDAEYSMSGNSGSFDVSLDTTKGYLVFEHGLLWSLFSQDVTVTFTVHGTAVSYLAGGIVMLVIGVVLIVYGARLGKKEAAIAPPQQQAPADVMMFDQQKPPSNP
jgi:hypothetical protein